LLVFDSTLRNAELATGLSLSGRNKLRMAHLLEQLGVDILEAGFAARGQEEFETLQQIAAHVQGPVISSLARCHEADVRRAGEALENARAGRIHLFLPLPANEAVNTRTRPVRSAVQAVRTARELVGDVQLSLVGALRADPGRLIEVLQAVVEAGARTVNLADADGLSTPEEVRPLVEALRASLPAEVVLSVECRNDLGLALPNSLAAVQGGADQVQCALNGTGEGAGSCALEELVTVLKVRGDQYGVTTRVDATKLTKTSRALSMLLGQPVPFNKAVVGRNAFPAQDGADDDAGGAGPRLRPEDVGATEEGLVLSRRTRRSAVQNHVRKLGYDLSEPEFEDLFAAFRDLAQRKEEVYLLDLEALVLGFDVSRAGPWTIESLETGTDFRSPNKGWAKVRLRYEGTGVALQEGTGDGPIDAAFGVIQRVTGTTLAVESFAVRSVSGGEDALGEADVFARHSGELLHGRAVDTDIVAAGAVAFLDIVNHVARRARRGAFAHLKAG